jgi:hypothetical protein
VKYERGSYIPEDDILHSHRRENLKPYIALTGWALSGLMPGCTFLLTSITARRSPLCQPESPKVPAIGEYVNRTFHCVETRERSVALVSHTSICV